MNHMLFVQTETEDGLYLKGLISEPEVQSKKIIIHIHGMSGDFYLNSYYPKMHEEYPKNGIAFLATENRGTHIIKGFQTKDGVKNYGNAYEIFEECIYDIDAWVKFAKDRGYTEIWIQSHSLGPSKVTYYMHTKKPEGISGLIFLSPSDMLGLVHDDDGRKDHEKLFPEAQALVSEGKGSHILSHYLWGDQLLSAQTYINFFSDNAKTAIFNYKNEKLGWEVVNSLSVPVLAITGTKDDGIVPVVDPHKAMEILERELKNSPRKKTIVYENAEHSFDGFDSQIVTDVLSFINN